MPMGDLPTPARSTELALPVDFHSPWNIKDIKVGILRDVEYLSVRATALVPDRDTGIQEVLTWGSEGSFYTAEPKTLRRHVKQAILKLVEHEIDEWFFKLGLGGDPHG